MWQKDIFYCTGIGNFANKLSEKIPLWQWSLIDKYPHTTYSQRIYKLIEDSLQISYSNIKEWTAKAKGRQISKGQNNPVTKKRLSDAATLLLQNKRKSKPHLALYSLVLEFDPNAVMEFRISFSAGNKFFDIFSPKLEACLEMHGRVWHDPSKSPKTLLPRCLKNVQNDAVKQKLAEEHGYKYLVFWDDESDSWRTTLEHYFKD
jgi:G:T-mismatch repair DNA endonuclease (very short patch repair protein)